MYWRDITDTDTVTSVRPESAGRYYLVNGQSPWWKQGKWPSFGEKPVALTFLASRDTTSTEEERQAAAVEYQRLVDQAAPDDQAE